MTPQIWKMRRITADERQFNKPLSYRGYGGPLWHLEAGKQNGKYLTACGLEYGTAGSYSASRPAAHGACKTCQRKAKAKQ
jgi:hypothetical protein